MTWVRNHPTPEGRAMGEQMARLSEPAVAQLAAAGEPDERCSSCAFRLGTIPNGCPYTQMDALKCVIEGTPFYCHMGEGPKGGVVCHGWYAGRVALKGLTATAPWPFSETPPAEQTP